MAVETGQHSYRSANREVTLLSEEMCALQNSQNIKKTYFPNFQIKCNLKYLTPTVQLQSWRVKVSFHV